MKNALQEMEKSEWFQNSLTRDRILEAASSLLQKNLFRRLGFEKIAKRAGCSHTTIYLYFKNKDEILFEVASAPLEKLYQTSLESINRTRV